MPEDSTALLRGNLDEVPGDRAVSLSRAQIADIIRAFTSEDWRRLEKAANYYADDHIAWQDLLQSALWRAMDEEKADRNCPADVNVVTFLIGIMRSIGSAEWAKRQRRPIQIGIVNHRRPDQKAADLPDPAMNAEDFMVRQQAARKVYDHVISLFDDDPQALAILLGAAEGLKGEKLRARTGVDETTYNNKRRLIRRRIDAAYPKGWRE